MENLRRVVQVLAFLFFINLFFLTVSSFDAKLGRTVLPSSAPIDTFFRLDPLLGASVIISARYVIDIFVIYGLPVVIGTIILGRFFCGWICPMGTSIDAVDTIFFRKRKQKFTAKNLPPADRSESDFWGLSKKPDSKSDKLASIKYYILGAVFVAAIFRVQIAWIMDPIVILTRALTFSVYPVMHYTGQVMYANNINLPIFHGNMYFPADTSFFFRANFIALIILLVIFALEKYSRRFWCRNLCPLGALLALLSKVSIIRRLVGQKCKDCGVCKPACKMGAILDDPINYQATECIYCYSCTPACPQLETKIVPSLSGKSHRTTLDLNRRRLIGAMGIGAGVAVLSQTRADAKLDRNNRRKVSSQFLLRPPGAIPEEMFVNGCVRCTECMKVCPTGGLQPSISEAGLEGLWTPILVPRLGECSEKCNLCSQVCPTHTIAPVELEEKKYIYIGTAVVDRSHCIAWNSDKQCLLCDEACSYNAIYWQEVDGVRRPFVDEHLCVGCGICENVCPIQPVAAIRVYADGDRRDKSKEERVHFFKQAPDHTKDRPF